jgi:hypothetical protein
VVVLVAAELHRPRPIFDLQLHCDCASHSFSTPVVHILVTPASNFAGLGLFLGLPANLLLWGALVVPFVSVGLVSRFWPLLRSTFVGWKERLQQQWKDRTSGAGEGGCNMYRTSGAGGGC